LRRLPLSRRPSAAGLSAFAGEAQIGAIVALQM
jgi:hypothetical protein